MADNSLFVFYSAKTIIYLLLYVDDIIITGNNSFQINLITALGQVFELKDLGSLHYFLGIQITKSSYGLTLTQSKYASDVLHRFHMENTKPTKTPSCSSTHLVPMMKFLSQTLLYTDAWWVLSNISPSLALILPLVFNSCVNS